MLALKKDKGLDYDAIRYVSTFLHVGVSYSKSIKENNSIITSTNNSQSICHSKI